MAAFQEMKPAFSKKLNGYSIEEVDSYIVPLLARQSTLAAENDSLKKQLLEALKTLQPAKENAEKLQNAARDAEAKAQAIVAEAQRQADFLIQSARQACDAELAAFRASLQEEAQLFAQMRNLVSSFHARALEQCRAQMEAIERNAQELGAIPVPDEAEFAARVLEKMRADLVAKKQREQEQEQTLRRAELRTAMRTEQYLATGTQGESKNVVWTDKP